ncbi:MAG: tetratricopeptide repeat protein [Saprospiraceae bacterium]|nr:tetratricopeptide repeat protein [Saprospiraceae bacterium]
MLAGNSYKVIFQGKLEFGNERSFQKALQFFEQKAEVLYKKEVLFKTSEQLFNLEDKTLTIPRFIGTSGEKMWKNTISLLEYCAQFSLAGSLNAWMADSGQVLQHVHIEPKGEKSSVMLYHEGRKMAEQHGRELEAIQLLTEAIEKCDRHSQAYEKRGYVNYHLKNYDDAIYDFRKSTAIDAMNASAHFGLAKTLMVKGQFEAACASFDQAVRQSIALQPLHWASRRSKGVCHLELNQFEEAAFEFKLFTARKFPEADPNLRHLTMTWFNYGKALFALGRLDAALEAFDKSLDFRAEDDGNQAAEIFVHRGMARMAAGNADYILDLKKAAEMGSVRASELLANQA